MDPTTRYRPAVAAGRLQPASSGGLERRSLRLRISRGNVVATATLAAMLVVVFWLWSFAYFWTDDFLNIYWIQSETGRQMLRHVFDPSSTFYRPVGECLYWLLYRAFGINPLPYHVTGWGLHAINTALMFVLLRRLLDSPFAAMAGVIPFAFRVNFADMYWSFGTVFDLLACLLMLLGILSYIRWRRRILGIALVCFIYIAAVKSKEMAITLPAVLLLYELCVAPRPRLTCRGFALWLGVPLLVGLWLTHLKVNVMRDMDPSLPYYFEIDLWTAYQGYAQYLNWMTGLEAPAWLWLAAAALFLAFLFWNRVRLGIFFAVYTALAFAPVIFLPNHRWPYFWYIPFLGIAGLIGLGARSILTMIRPRWALARLVILNTAALVLWASLVTSVEIYRSRQTRAYEAGLAAAIHTYANDLRALERPEPDAVLYFTEMPPHFREEILNDSVQVLLRRPDLRAKLVKEFPQNARWKLRFRNGRLERIG
ncbi:MAG TPA: hypothetical protein VFY29_20730 [Terriglobia bacterium]|nr:hypothetical protein [Terriglobia bacterium]